MALSRLLLLCMVASEVWDAETKPIDFVCNKDARGAMNIVEEMEEALHHERRGDVVASLGLLAESVEAVKGQSQEQCASPFLERLGNNINNYRRILTNLQLNESAVSPELSCAPRSTGSLSTVLHSFKKLITGKLEWFVVDLEDMCTSQ